MSSSSRNTSRRKNESISRINNYFSIIKSSRDPLERSELKEEYINQIQNLIRLERQEQSLDLVYIDSLVRVLHNLENL